MAGAKYYVTRRSFGSLAASLAGTLRDSCGTRAKHRCERKINIQYRGFLTPVICILSQPATPTFNPCPLSQHW